VAKKGSRKTTTSSVRVPAVNTSYAAPTFTYRPLLPSLQLNLLEDRRRYYPDDFRPPAAVYRSATQPVARPSYSKRPGVKYSFRPTQTKAVVAFRAPEAVAVCVRRKMRKEVLHAKGKAGGKVRKPKFNSLSKYRC